MDRYYEDYGRAQAHENLLEHGDSVTCEQLRDICELIRDERYPDGTFSDCECVVYECIKEVLGIEF